MAESLLMPTLGLTMTEGTVDQWYKQVGDPVAKGEAIVSISSEKLTHDVESPIDGVLLDITADNGEEIVCQGVIGYVGEVGESVSNNQTPEEIISKADITVPEVPKENPIPTPKRVSGERIFATPLARKIAADKGYSLEEIIGTGGNGRITRRDVERFIPQVTVAASSQVAGEGLEGMRKVIAQRMHHSLQQSAQLTLHRKADITQLLAFRRDLKEKTGDQLGRSTLSFNTLLIKAVSLALRDKPEMNASYNGTEYKQHDVVHMGVAVAVDDGLVVPVIRDVTTKTLSEIGSEFIKVTSQAIDGTLPGDLYSGSTFTITNLGTSGVEYFTPILNTPEIDSCLGLSIINKSIGVF